MARRRPLCTALASASLAVSAIAGCSDDDDLLDAACDVVVSECDRCRVSVSECIDLLGPETPDCMACIVESGDSYTTRCNSTPDGDLACRLPPALAQE